MHHHPPAIPAQTGNAVWRFIVRRTLSALVSLIAFGLVGCAAVTADEPTIAQGQKVATANCAACHAVTLADSSPRADAPPLRDLYKRYSNHDLRRAVEQGIHIGHADMPTFRLGARDAQALAAYLWELNPCARPSSDEEAMERCFSRL